MQQILIYVTVLSLGASCKILETEQIHLKQSHAPLLFFSQDVSYLHCIEIQGPENNILDGMNQLCDAKVGLTFRSLTFLKGNDEGRVMLYRKRRYPQECIGWVTYCWRYGDTDPQSRSLWVWVHPAFYQQLLSELYSVFNLNEVIKLSTQF